MQRNTSFHIQSNGKNADLYFVTLFTSGDAILDSSTEGKNVMQNIDLLCNRYSDVSILDYAVANKHVYMLVNVSNEDLRTKHHDTKGCPFGLAALVRQVKSSVSADKPFWQSAFTEHVISSESQLILYSKLIQSINCGRGEKYQ